jgi:hypothetical protein
LFSKNRKGEKLITHYYDSLEYRVIKLAPERCLKYCGWFPCIITHNSSKAYKKCPCHRCPVAVTCNYACHRFNNIVKGIFGLERVNSNYRYVEHHGDLNVLSPSNFMHIALSYSYLKEEDRI